VADVGDGWDSTYAVAYYISQNLALQDPSGKTHETERGAVMVMGGDQVYPSATREGYNNQLLQPYAAAQEKSLDPNHYPHLFVVPGNHDWYDSLSSFTRLFCQQRWFAAWKTRQYRSYFALKLPHRWWLIGTDVQLASDVDDAQVKYFRRIAEQFMQPDDRIILCNAEPHWIYAHIYGQNDDNYKDNNLAFLEMKVFEKQKIAAFIAGDLHHYRRHAAPDGTQKITAGGGGAFLHPTHGPNVEEMPESDVSARSKRMRRVFKCEKSFPEIAKSTQLCRRNWGFPFFEYSVRRVDRHPLSFYRMGDHGPLARLRSSAVARRAAASVSQLYDQSNWSALGSDRPFGPDLFYRHPLGRLPLDRRADSRAHSSERDLRGGMDHRPLFCRVHFGQHISAKRLYGLDSSPRRWNYVRHRLDCWLGNYGRLPVGLFKYL
jgi:hypothetical protein